MPNRVGPYELLEPLGRGGMGEVYRASDPRLGRAVAVKLIRAEAFQEGERRRRFEREARAASSLNHPNIVTVHDIGEQDGAPYLVTELVDGVSLRVLMGSASPPFKKMLDIAAQIADGLAAAHAAGITHRDLKPENIMVTREGRVKILDFGLAKAEPRVPSSGETPTLTAGETSPGTILGTVSYMSPEQARGQAVDFRSDQFSLGSILYEMVADKRPFDREESVETLAAIVREEPEPLAAIEPPVPAPLRWVIERCLAKEPAERYASTADLHQQLRDLRAHLSEILSAQITVAPRAALRRRLVKPALVLAGLVVGFLIALAVLPHQQPGIAPASFIPFATEADDETKPSWAPDGQSIAYLVRVAGANQVFVKSLSSPAPVQLTKTSADCSRPFWSPDGKRIYFISRSALWFVGASGGEPEVVVKNVWLAAASPNGKDLAFYPATQDEQSLWFHSLERGNSRQYKRPPFPESFRFGKGLAFSPDGKILLAGVEEQIGLGPSLDVWTLPVPEGLPRRVPVHITRSTGMSDLRWFPGNRHVLFSNEVAEGSGSHLYLLDTRTGRVEPVTAGPGEESDPSVSPDGRKIAFGNGAANWDLIEVDLKSGAVSELLATSRREVFPAWAASGRQYVYVSNASGSPAIWLRSTTEGWARKIAGEDKDGSVDRSRPRLSPDGQRLAYARIGARHLIWVASVEGGRAVPLEEESTDQHAPAWSPDGQWIVYSRYSADRWEVARAPSGGGGKPLRLADGGGTSPLIEWSSDGRWIAYDRAGRVSLVSPDGQIQRQLPGPRPATWGFSKDGKSIYAVRRSAQRTWQLVRIQIPDGPETALAGIPLSADVQLDGFSLHPGGTRFATSTGVTRQDIWIMERRGPRSTPFLLRWFRGLNDSP